MTLGLSFPVCEMVGLGQMVIKCGPGQAIAYSERTTNFWLNKAASFTPTESHFCIIIIIQYGGNDVLLICVRVAVSFINHKWELHGHSHSLVFPVGNQLLTQFDIPHSKHKSRGATVPQPCRG